MKKKPRRVVTVQPNDIKVEMPKFRIIYGGKKNDKHKKGQK